VPWERLRVPHESATTQRAYRKEAERLILWAIVERSRALSSLTTDDAIKPRDSATPSRPHSSLGAARMKQ
jgi:hypothetical protein